MEIIQTPSLRFQEFSEIWLSKTTGEISDCIVPGRNKPKQFNGNIPWITTPDIEHGSVITSSKIGLALTKEEAKSVGSKIVPTNSVIISCVGELGLVAVTVSDIVINQQLHAFIPFKDINYRFLMYSLTKRKEYITKVATKTAVPYLNKTNCNSIPIFVPSLPEQQKIAAFLTVVDDKIQQLSKKKALLENYKKGIMQQIFSQEIRFKDDDGREYTDWEEKQLGLLSDVRDGTHESPRYHKVGYPLVTSKNLMNDGRIDLKNVSLISKTDYKNINKRSHVDVGDILFAMIGTIGNPVLVKSNGFAIKNVALIKPGNSLLNSYLIQYLKSPKIDKQFYEKNAGGTQKFLSLSVIRLLFVEVPSISEQHKIANFLSAIDNKIDQVNQQLENTKQYKKGLLQQMFI